MPKKWGFKSQNYNKPYSTMCDVENLISWKVNAFL